ncbi:MAG: hypothetical protein O3A14_14990 [Cyanobacteria bacterium]|nr:hypothetical protein [Cyanobacteriota bacterium]
MNAKFLGLTGGAVALLAIFPIPAEAVTSTFFFEGEISEFEYKFPSVPPVANPDSFEIGSNFKLTYTLLDGPPASGTLENPGPLEYCLDLLGTSDCNSILTFSLVFGSDPGPETVFNHVKNSAFLGVSTLDGRFVLNLEGLIDSPDIEQREGIPDHKDTAQLGLDRSILTFPDTSKVEISATRDVCVEVAPGLPPDCDGYGIESWFRAEASITKAESVPEPTSVLGLEDV